MFGKVFEIKNIVANTKRAEKPNITCQLSNQSVIYPLKVLANNIPVNNPLNIVPTTLPLSFPLIDAAIGITTCAETANSPAIRLKIYKTKILLINASPSKDRPNKTCKIIISFFLSILSPRGLTKNRPKPYPT